MPTVCGRIQLHTPSYAPMYILPTAKAAIAHTIWQHPPAGLYQALVPPMKWFVLAGKVVSECPVQRHPQTHLATQHGL